jgi:glycosyltransferase involved in cell wall biosynthesis
VLATSSTNLPGLLGAARSVLDGVPVALYMHENQLTYPISPMDREDLTYAMINWTSMTVADLVLFNSRFHHDVWFEAIHRLLGRYPDERHTALIDDVRRRSEVLTVGVSLERIDAVPDRRGERPLVLWNQRWEYDKDPDEFAAAVRAVAGDVEFDVALAGEASGEPPPAFLDLARTLGSRMVHWGYAPDAAYVELLRRASVVVSTARQEFFGIAVTEAIYAGAFPLLPNRLVYPERLPRGFHERCLWATSLDLADKLRWALTHPGPAAEVAHALRPAMESLGWERVAPSYDGRFERLVDDGRRTR